MISLWMCIGISASMFLLIRSEKANYRVDGCYYCKNCNWTRDHNPMKSKSDQFKIDPNFSCFRYGFCFSAIQERNDDKDIPRKTIMRGCVAPGMKLKHGTAISARQMRHFRLQLTDRKMNEMADGGIYICNDNDYCSAGDDAAEPIPVSYDNLSTFDFLVKLVNVGVEIYKVAMGFGAIYDKFDKSVGAKSVDMGKVASTAKEIGKLAETIIGVVKEIDPGSMPPPEATLAVF